MRQLVSRSNGSRKTIAGIERAIAVDGPPAPGRERRVADELVGFAIGERRLTGRQRRHGQRQRQVRAPIDAYRRAVFTLGQGSRAVSKIVQEGSTVRLRRGMRCGTRGFYTPVAPFRCVPRVALIGL